MNKTKKIFASLFIIFQFFIMARIFVPLDTQFWKNTYKPIDSYLSFFSIYQDWMMFAPNPTRQDSKLKAIIEFEDGKKTIYEFGSEERNFWTKKLYKEKMRKLVDGYATSNDLMLKDLARYSLRKIQPSHFDRIPLRVSITQETYFTPDLKQTFIPYNEIKKEFQTKVLYVHEV